MVTDHEAVLVELAAHIASKPQHGREGLLREIADLSAKHRAPAGEKSQLLRLYGVEVGREHAAAVTHHHTGDETVPLAGGTPSPTEADSPTTMTRGGHDGDEVSRGRAEAA